MQLDNKAIQRSIDARAASEPRPVAFQSRRLHLSYLRPTARILLISALLGAPLAFGAVVPVAWLALGLVASLALFLWALGTLEQGRITPVWSPLYIPLALFFLLGAAQYAARLTLDTSETRQALVLLATDLIFFFLAVQLFGGARCPALQPFGVTVMIYAGGMGLFALLESASGAQGIYGLFDTPNGGMFGPYVNRDHFAGLMEMLLPVAILYMAGRHGRLSLEGSVWRVSAAVLALAAQLLSGSRAGLLALAAEIVIATLVLRRAALRTHQKRRLATAAAFALVAGVILFAYLDPGRVRLGAAIGCCGLLVHSFADFNLHIPANAAWFAVLAGIGTSER